MRRWGPVLAIAWVLVAAAITLLGVARNRSGEPEADVVLTERELPLAEWRGPESSGLSLRLAWRGPRFPALQGATWLDRKKIESLGFDCSYPVEAPSAREHYQRMFPREVVLVLEYEGDAWKRWIEDKERETEEVLRKGQDGTDARAALERERTSGTRLVAVDAGLDAAALRRLHPDRSRYILVRAVVAPLVETGVGKESAKPPTLRGQVRWLSVQSLHVPHGKSALLDSLVASDRNARKEEPPPAADPPDQPGRAARSGPPRYEVRVRWGRRLEPWIVGVEAM